MRCRRFKLDRSEMGRTTSPGARPAVNRAGLTKAATSLGVPLSEKQLDQFEVFEENVYATNEVMNLTRIPREECWLRHFVDSLLFQDLIPPGSSVLDIGTGPGLPAWPLACARPDLQVTALDSSGKMIAFLERNSLPNLSAVLARAEDWKVRERFDAVTGRALAPLSIQMELSAAPCKLGGMVLPMRTPAEADAIKSFEGDGLGLRLERIEQRVLNETEVVRLFPVFRKFAKTDRHFPRSWAEIKRQPLL